MPESFLYPSERYDGAIAHEGRKYATPVPQCDHTITSLGALVTRNGTRQIKLYCVDCDHPLGGAIPYSLLRDELGIEPDDLPVWRDQESDHQPCEVCGRLAHLHEHHWAPRHLFSDPVLIYSPTVDELRHKRVELGMDFRGLPDSTWTIPECDLWPRSMLCPSCHQRWHSIVTPNMSRRKAS